MYKNKLKKKNKIFLIEVSFSNKFAIKFAKFSNTRRNCLIMSNVLVGRYSIYL